MNVTLNLLVKVVESDKYDTITNADNSIKMRAEAVFETLPQEFLSLLTKRNSQAITAFNELLDVIDPSLNARTIDRYRRLFLAKPVKIA